MKKGFTLLELIIVVVVLGMLAGIAIPRYIDARRNALRFEAQANVELMAAAQKISWMETRSYIGCTGCGECNNRLRLALPCKTGFSYQARGADGWSEVNLQGVRCEMLPTESEPRCD